jgi:AcrR family transcriptional regulator
MGEGAVVIGFSVLSGRFVALENTNHEREHRSCRVLVFSQDNSQTEVVSAPRTARDRVRDEVTREILAVAAAHLAEEGAAALSLRSIARDLGMVPSALYRYFNGRDALLSALILEAYASLANQAEKAADQAAGRPEASDGARWGAVPSAMRDWAQARPHEWGLIFGSPVPGYQAPEETVAPYARLATALVRPVAEAQRAGRLRAPAAGPAAPLGLEAAMAPVREALLPDAPSSTVELVLQAWCTLVGCISLELFGHWRNTVLDPALFFGQTVTRLGDELGLQR